MAVQLTSDEPAVEVVDLQKAFADFTALRDVSVNIPKNEFFSLLGPSGCGKTTLLRIIGGFEAPTGGDVRIHGQSVLNLPPYLRKTNMVFQHLALFPHLNVAQNIMFPLEMKRISAVVARKKTMDVLDMVRLSGMQDRKIHELSGGQRQRVAIARALVGDPEVVLLDEPLGALDLKLRLQMQEELHRLQRAVGSTFIFVTHDQAEAITMSDRIAVMQAGRIVQVGTPYDIYETPSCRFVADFIGHSNLLKGIAQGQPSPGRCVVVVDGIALTGACRDTVAAGREVTVSIRYEKVRVTRSAVTDCANTFQANVVERKYLGSATRLRLALSPSQVLQADLPPESEVAAFQQGERVNVSIEPGNVLVLPD
jgi:ABC-type Fe3+/spermidine/putrescine transport system ATPase subunit